MDIDEQWSLMLTKFSGKYGKEGYFFNLRMMLPPKDGYSTPIYSKNGMSITLAEAAVVLAFFDNMPTADNQPAYGYMKKLGNFQMSIVDDTVEIKKFHEPSYAHVKYLNYTDFGKVVYFIRTHINLAQ